LVFSGVMFAMFILNGYGIVFLDRTHHDLLFITAFDNGFWYTGRMAINVDLIEMVLW
jgi:hypothetical protein